MAGMSGVCLREGGGVRIEEVDARDAAVFGEWFAVVDAVGRHTRPGERDYSEQELRATALDGRAGEDGTEPRLEQQDLWHGASSSR